MITGQIIESYLSHPKAELPSILVHFTSPNVSMRIALLEVRSVSRIVP
jgi:hypothetical protein